PKRWRGQARRSLLGSRWRRLDGQCADPSLRHRPSGLPRQPARPAMTETADTHRHPPKARASANSTRSTTFPRFSCVILTHSRCKPKVAAHGPRQPALRRLPTELAEAAFAFWRQRIDTALDAL